MLCSCYFNMTHAIDLFVIHFSVIAVYSNMSTMFNSSVEDLRTHFILMILFEYVVEVPPTVQCT